ncbi:MAG: hypothetical protein HY842_13135, partial [Bacteroidetes bacterium]|nr:hypothetical protein [Bacteroidota bacterium]
MEENLPNDRLEEFLRKSFEGHSESPPDDLWAKIEAGLEPPVAAPRLTFRHWGWAAAAAVLAGLLVCQHLYFNQKINHLGKALEKNATEVETLEGSQAAENQAVVPKVELAEPATQPVGEGGTELPADVPTGTQQPVSRQTAATGGKKLDIGKLKTTDANFPKEKQRVTDDENMPLDAPSVVGSEEKNGQDAATRNDTETHLENPENLVLAAIPALLSSKNRLLKTPLPAPLSGLNLMSITWKKNAPAGKFSVGVHALPMATWEKIKAQKPPFGPQPVVGDEVEISGQTLMTGLAVETKLTPRLSLGTGVDYRRTVFESEHQANFHFEDRRPHHPGMGNNQHDFEYNLNTPVGVVEVVVRAESKDPTIQIMDDEEIGLDIKTRQTFEHVSVPLYAGYSLGNGRLRTTLKGGFLLNFLVNNDFEIIDIDSPNSKFNFPRGREQRGRPQDLQSVSVDYIAGIGLDY